MTYIPTSALPTGTVSDGAVTMAKLASDVTATLSGKATATHTHAQSDITNLVTDLAGKAAASHSHSIANVTNLQTTLDGKAASSHTHAAADVTGLATFLTNFTPTTAATSATTGAMTVAMGEGVRTITPTGNCTFNASGGVAGQRCTFSITTSGASSFTLTWGTNFRKTGTLATGATTARFFTVTFVCLDGTVWQETGRTAVQT